MKAESRKQKAEMSEQRLGRKAWQSGAFLLSAFCFLLFSCRTVGVSRSSAGYAEVSPTIAAEMILDSNQVVVLDVRTPDQYRGTEGHIGGALSAPFDTIERQLPELLPYQNQTVLVYGETSNDGALAAKLLTVAGFRNVVQITGGMQAWIERGYRVVNSR
ncbi:MAG TPA: rhodanese-like domain-containing protein [Thermoanaerobaculia bacterium]|nr:rhodanese-like domain-containing protein [Thermoanaerobaculia bacterium]